MLRASVRWAPPISADILQAQNGMVAKLPAATQIFEPDNLMQLEDREKMFNFSWGLMMKFE